MTGDASKDGGMTDAFAELLEKQAGMVQQLFGQFMPASPGNNGEAQTNAAGGWMNSAKRLQELWLEFLQGQAAQLGDGQSSFGPDIQNWPQFSQNMLRQLPLAKPERLQSLWDDSLMLWQGILGQYGVSPEACETGQDKTELPRKAELPRKDHRFADPAWREQPFFALLHQTYLMLAEQMSALADTAEDIEP